MKAIGRALFLDLDGTLIITKTGGIFPKSRDDWQFKPGILPIITDHVTSDYYIMIVSNQGGIESGHITMNDFRLKIKKVIDEVIKATGCPFSRISFRYCMSNSKDDYFRKPNPGMAYDLAMCYILNLGESVMIGDASGKVRRTEDVYTDASSPSLWSYKDGQHVAEVDVDKIVNNGGKVGKITFKDFADSDLRFAQACGMQYFDVDDYIEFRKAKQIKIEFTDAKIPS